MAVLSHPDVFPLDPPFIDESQLPRFLPGSPNTSSSSPQPASSLIRPLHQVEPMPSTQDRQTKDLCLFTTDLQSSFTATANSTSDLTIQTPRYFNPCNSFNNIFQPQTKSPSENHQTLAILITWFFAYTMHTATYLQSLYPSSE
eukprot:Gb_34230 [translate_table: standard]